MKAEQEKIINVLNDRLEAHDENRKAVQSELRNLCNELKKQIDEMEIKINSELEKEFLEEDNRLQGILSPLRSGEDILRTIQKAKAELVVSRKYLFDKKDMDISKICSFGIAKEISEEWLLIGKPKYLEITKDSKNVFASFTSFNSDEERVIRQNGFDSKFTYKALIHKKGQGRSRKECDLLRYEKNKSMYMFPSDIFDTESTYVVKVKTVFNNKKSDWSDGVEFTTQEFNEICSWKKCPDNVIQERKYSLLENSPRIATKIANGGRCSIVGDTYLPLNKVTSWGIMILKAGGNHGTEVIVGVAPFDIDQDVTENYNKCGWYFDCYNSTLCSGPPHNYSIGHEYGPKRERYGDRNFVAGDTIGVVMDTTNRELSFILKGVNYGVAYEGIPLDKPLVPCVILRNGGDAIEFDPNEMKENVDSSIPVPSNIRTSNGRFDYIGIEWNSVKGATSYQVKMGDCRSLCTTSFSEYGKVGLLPEKEYEFRIRTIKDNAVSEWSSLIKGKTNPAPGFSDCVWMPSSEYNSRYEPNYAVGKKNPRTAKKMFGYEIVTVVGNRPIPQNKVTSWDIKITKSGRNTGTGIFVGVAPSDIDRSAYDNSNKCGWYFECGRSTLHSGPPHNYNDKKCGQRRKGQHVTEGHVVGVTMDMINATLSFSVDDEDLGVAYEGIPLDKSLVPCVLIKWKHDSVELILNDEKKTVAKDPSPYPLHPPVPITYSDSPYYTVVRYPDGSCSITSKPYVPPSEPPIQKEPAQITSKPYVPPSKPSIQKEPAPIPPSAQDNKEDDNDNIISLISDTEDDNDDEKNNPTQSTNSIVSTANPLGNTATVPNVPVNEVAQPRSYFSLCTWKSSFTPNGDYLVNEKNRRIVTKINNNNYISIVGNMPIPLYCTTSWKIKILKMTWNNGEGIHVGVAPSDIDQNGNFINYRCGWYMSCYDSALVSGPPHNYGEGHEAKKLRGQCAHEGDTVDAVMDTTKGGLSFSINGVNNGVMYAGIPLDKPLVPCVVLRYLNDSVELII